MFLHGMRYYSQFVAVCRSLSQWSEGRTVYMDVYPFPGGDESVAADLWNYANCIEKVAGDEFRLELPGGCA